MASLLFAVVVLAAVAFIAWRAIALYKYTFHKKNL